jgi:hypothetical protein
MNNLIKSDAIMNNLIKSDAIFAQQNKGLSKKSWDLKLLLMLSMLSILLIFPVAAREVLFDFSDPKDDDKGPGYYVYPEWEVFNDGCFDMRRFRVVRDGDFIIFETTFEGEVIRYWREGSDRWTGDNGWILQNIDIYIDTDRVPGSGQKLTIPGRNVELKNDSFWEKMVLISPQRKEPTLERLKNRSENIEIQKLVENKNIIIPNFYTLKKYQIIAKVDIKEIGIPQPWWGWQVMISGNDKQETNISFYTRRVSSFKDRYSFGGGSDYNGDPNVIDILSDSKETQYSQLKNYISHPDSKKNSFASVSALSVKNRPNKTNEFELPKKDYLAVLNKIRKNAYLRKEKEPQEFMDISAPSPENANNTFTASKEQKEARNIETRIIESNNSESNNTETGNIETGNIDIDNLYGRSGKSSDGKMNNQTITPRNPEIQQAGSPVIQQKLTCQKQMYSILNAARDYHEKNPQDSNITLLDIIYAGYFKDKIECPSGGKYAIYGEENNEIKVRCFNPGGIEHGSVP